MPRVVPVQPTETQPSVQAAPIRLSRISLGSKDLPSRMLSYPKGAEISYRPYTFGEIKALSQSKLSRGEEIKFILEGIYTSFPKEELSYADMLYITLLRKLSTLSGSKFHVMFKCPQCGHPVSTLLELSSIEFDELNIPVLPIVGDFSWGETEFTVLTVQSYLKLLELGKQEDEVSALALMSNLPFEKAVELFNAAVGEDARLLTEMDSLTYHGVKERDYQCERKDPPCGHEFSVAIDGGLEVLLIPFRGDSEPPKSRVRFGKTPAHPTNSA